MFQDMFKAHFRDCSGAGPVRLLHVSLAIHWTFHNCCFGLTTHVVALSQFFMYIAILSTAALHQSCRGRHVRVDRIRPNDEKWRTIKNQKLKGQLKICPSKESLGSVCYEMILVGSAIIYLTET